MADAADRPSGRPDASASNSDESAVSYAATALRAGWEAENRAAAARYVAAYEVMVECIEHPDCADDPLRPRPGYAVVDPLVMATGYVVAMFPISTRLAKALICAAWDLHNLYPAILSAMQEGRLSDAEGRILAQQLSHVDLDVLPRVQQEVVDDYLAKVEAGERPGNKAIRDRADEIITKHDQDGVRRRKSETKRERGAWIRKGRDGMSTLSAYLLNEEAAVLAEALEAKMAATKAAEEEAAAAAAASAASSSDAPDSDAPASDAPFSGSADSDREYARSQRRADALMSSVCGDAADDFSAGHPDPDDDDNSDLSSSAAGPNEDPDPSGSPSNTDTTDDADTADSGVGTDSPASPGSTGNGTTGTDSRSGGLILRPKVTVIAPFGSNDEAKVDFARTGEAALQALLDLLKNSSGASLEHIDPGLGAADDPDAAIRYRPSAALARRIRLRDGTCRHPGCMMPVEDCDLDHVVPFNHDDPSAGGLTVEWNMAGMCREHHKFKTHSGWEYKMEPDGTLIMTSPEGHVTVTRPNGPLAAYRREETRAEAEAWNRQQRRSPDPRRAAAAGGADSDEHASRTAMSRRDARRHARRERNRASNIADRFAHEKREAVRKARNTARARDFMDFPPDIRATGEDGGPIVEARPGPNGTTIHIARHNCIFNLRQRRGSRWWSDNRHRYPVYPSFPVDEPEPQPEPEPELDPEAATESGTETESEPELMPVHPQINEDSAVERALRDALVDLFDPPPF